MTHDAPNPGYAAEIEAHVMGMPVARTLDLRFARLAPGEAHVEVPYAEALSFQPGQFQATAVFAAADFAGVCAAATLLPAGWGIVTVDCTLKLLAPAAGVRLRATARVVRPGRRQTVSQVEVRAHGERGEVVCAVALVTSQSVPPG